MPELLQLHRMPEDHDYVVSKIEAAVEHVWNKNVAERYKKISQEQIMG